MTPDERQLLAGLFDRVRDAANSPRDRDADTFIQDAVRSQPYAPYLLAQTVIVQEQALRAANERLQHLDAENAELQRRAAAPADSGSGSFLGGLGKSIFGSGSQQPEAPRGPWGQPGQPQQPQQNWGAPAAPPQNQGFGGGGFGGGGFGGGQPAQAPGGGGSFLKGALGAAAGVAGGVLLADSIRGLFGGHNNALGIGSGFGGGTPTGGFGGGGETVVNNYYESSDRGSDTSDDKFQTASDTDDDSSSDDFETGGSNDDGTYDA